MTTPTDASATDGDMTYATMNQTEEPGDATTPDSQPTEADLVTVNGELKLKIEELSRANSDLFNLMASTNVGVIFLDTRLQVKRFTPRATELFHLIEGDIGRPFEHIAHRIRSGAIGRRPLEMAQQVNETREQIEAVVQSDNERWYILRLFPYRTLDQVTDGVVITLIDITDWQRAEHELQQRRQQQLVADLGRQALQGASPQALIDSATHQISALVGSELSAVFVRQPAGHLLLEAGIGWQPHRLGQAMANAEQNSLIWSTLHVDKPVMLEETLVAIEAARAPLLVEHGIVSGVSVTIGGRARPYGVLGVYSTQPHSYTQYDVDFLQAVANLLAEAITRHAQETQLAFQADVLEQVSEAVIAVDQEERIIYLNAAAVAQYELDPTAAIGQPLGYAYRTEWGQSDRELLADAALAEEGYWRGENRHIKRDGSTFHVEATVCLLRDRVGNTTGQLACIRDITARKQTELALQATQARYRELTNVMPHLVWTANERGLVDYYNIRVHDYDNAVWNGAYGFDWEQLLHPEDLLPTSVTWQQAIANRQPYTCEHRLHMADGSWRWHLSRAVPVRDANNEIKWYGTATDIHERKLAEERVRASEERLRIGTTVAGLAIAEVDYTTDLIHLSPEAATLFGLPADTGTTVRATVHALFHPDDRAELFRRIDEALDPTGPGWFNMEHRIVRPDGQTRWLSVRKQIFFDPRADGPVRPVRALLAALDITDHQVAEAALRASEERYRMLFATMDEGFCIFEMLFDEANKPVDYRFLEVNPAFERFTGLVDAVGKTARHLVPNLEAHWFEIYGAVALTGAPRRFVEGSAAMGRWFEVYAFRFGGPESRRVALLFNNITERKLFEDALRDSEEELRYTIELNPQVPWTADPAGNIISFNQRWLDLTGLTEEEALGGGWVQAPHPDDRPAMMAAWTHAIQTGTHYDIEHRIRQANGEYRWMRSRAFPRHNEAGAIVRWYGATEDIHERKLTEEQLRASEQFSRTLLESSPDCVKVLDAEGQMLRMNGPGLCLMEIDDFEPLVGQAWENLWPTDCGSLIRRTLTAARAGQEGRFQGFCPTAKGTPKWWDVIVAPVQNDQGVVTHFIAASRDITEAKATEETLRENEARLQTILQNIPVSIYLLSPDQRYLYVNRHYEQLAQITTAEIQGKSIYAMFAPETAAALVANDQRALAAKTVIEVEEFAPQDGVIHTYASIKVPLLNADGEPYALLGISSDITERKQTEASLRASEARFRTLANTVPSIIWTAAPDGTITYVNDQWLDYCGLTPEANARQWPELVLHPDDFARCVSQWSDALATGAPYEIEVRNRRHDGLYRWFLTRATPLHNEEGHVTAWFGVTTDIEERKQAELNQQLLERISLMVAEGLDASALMWRATQQVGEFFTGYRCGFADIDMQTGMSVLHHDWCAVNAASVAGTYRNEDFLATEFMATLDNNEPVVVDDVTQDPRTAPYADNWAPFGIAAFAFVPIFRSGKWTALFFVHLDKPHGWRTDEVQLLRDVTAHVWPAVERARAEDALRISETRFRQLADAMPQIVWQTDAAGMSLYFNQRWLEYTGLTPAESLADANRAIHPDDRAEAVRVWEEVRPLGKPYEYELRLRQADGAYRWHLVRCVPIHTDEGHLLCWYGTSTDIDAGKRANEALRASEERLRLATEAGGVGIFDHDLIANQTEVSAIYRQLTGLPPEAVVTRESWLALVHPEDRSLVTAIWQEVQNTSTSYYYECRLLRPDGAVIWAEVNAWVTRDATGRSARITGAVRDITERKQAALHQQFLLDLNGALRTLHDADAIQQTVVKRLGQYLGVDRCRFNAIDLAAGQVQLLAAWSQPGLPPPSPVHSLADHTLAEYIAFGRAGRTLVVQDILQEVQSKAPGALLKERGFRSTIRVPCLREGQWVASVQVLQSTPRQWRQDEVQLVESVVHHFWPLVEKARVESELRRHEEFLRQIADNVPGLVGYLGADERYRFVNAAFERWFQRPRQKIVGQTVAELLGEQGRTQLADYRQRALAGEIVSYETDFAYPDGVKRTVWSRYQPDIATDGRVLGFYLFLMDITERKQVETDQQLLADLAEQIRLADAAPALVAAAVRLVGDHLQVGRCLWIELDEEQQRGSIHAQHCRGLPPVAVDYTQTDYSPATRAELTAGRVLVNHDARHDPRTADFYETVYAPQQERAYVGVPLLHEGVWRGILSVTEAEARQWQPREIHLLETVAERVWLAVEKLRLHAEVRRVNERFTLAEAAVAGWIYDYDWRTGMVTRSDGFYRLLGYAPEECQPTAEWWQSLIHPDDWQWLAQETGSLAPQGDLRLLEYRVRDRNGHYHHMWDRARVIRDETGAITRLVGSSVDISERKDAEAALQQSNAILSGVLESSTDAIFVRDLTGRYLLVNNAGAEQIGLPKAAIIGRRYQEIFAPAVVAAMTVDDQPVFAQGITVILEHMSEQNGVTRYWHTLKMPLRNADGVIVGLISSARDFTERKETEDALRASEVRFRHLADAMPQVVWTCRPDGTMTYVNGQWLAYSGMTLAETLEQGMWPALHPEDQPTNRAQWRHALESNTPYEGEIRLRRQDGVYRWFLERAIPVRDDADIIAQWFGVSVDITDRKDAEERLAAREAFLRAVTDAVPNLIGYIDHNKRYRFVNATYAQWFARPREEIEGNTMGDLLGEDLNAWRRHWQRALAGETVNFEETFTYPDGVTRTVMGTYIPDCRPDGQVYGFYLYINDITARKAAEAAVAARETELRVITDNIPGLISYLDREGRYRFANAAYSTWYGQPRAAILGHTMGEVMGPLYDMLQPFIERALQGELVRFEKTLPYRDTTRTIWGIYMPDVDEQGEVHGFYALVTDISERKAAEEALRRSEEMARQRLAELEAIYDTAPIGLCVLDRDLRWVRINERLAEINGIPAAAHIGRSVREVLPNLAPTAEPIMRTILETNQPLLNVELRGETPAQPGVARIWLEHWFPLHDQEGTVVGINVVAEEITERKRQEHHQQFLSELGMQLRLLSDPDAILAHLVAHLGQHLQLAGCRVNEIDLAREQFILQKDWVAADAPWPAVATPSIYPLTELAPPIVLADLQAGRTVAVANTLTDLRTTPVVDNYQTRQIHSFIGVPIFHQGEWRATLSIKGHGKRQWWQDEIDLLETVAGQLTSLLEKVRAEAALRELNATLEARVRERTTALELTNQDLARSNRELEQFTYAAAHDLRTPLRGIANLVQWISEDASTLLPAASQKHLALLQGRVKRLEQMLDDMLAYSQVGSVHYPLEKVDTYQLVHTLFELLAPPAGFTLEAAALPSLVTQRAPLEMVLRNLISNAIKHHQQPSIGQVQIVARDLDAWVEFRIRDNGPGIDPPFHERIFDMFQTLKPRDQVEGSGIGLALVKKTLESYGGQIWVESTVGQGATFAFTWPKGMQAG